MEARIEEKRKKYQEKLAPIKVQQEQYMKNIKAINAKDLKKVYLYFEKSNNEAATYVMEALVGLLRGQKQADSESVEMYIRKYEGFMIGLNRLDLKTVNQTHAQYILDQILQKYDKILVSQEFKIFIPFRNVLTKICLLALLYKDALQIEDTIKQREEELLKMQRDVE